MTTVLVVDDSAVERRLAGRLLETELGSARPPGAFRVLYAENGRQALAAMKEVLPDVVLTDMQMPEMDGLELVQEVRRTYPRVPIVLMTAHGSEDVAVQALRSGAASYVPKRNLARDLVETVEGILSLTHDARAEQRVLQCLTRSEVEFELESDTTLIPPLVRYLQEGLLRTRLCDTATALRVTVALREALVNAMEHGNLEVRSELKDADERAFFRLAAERRTQAPYRDRRVRFAARQSPDRVVYVIRDEGPGFAPGSLPDPCDPANLERPHGRGLLLIRTFMDDVGHNPAGNEITMVKLRG